VVTALQTNSCAGRKTKGDDCLQRKINVCRKSNMHTKNCHKNYNTRI